mmetsp:Transcript_27461/g.82297  ORF Transcript_27461/g.82297 Transcript_27461/m.82297 type:complete len:82 (-) Transcript_27461:150-395(-)
MQLLWPPEMVSRAMSQQNKSGVADKNVLLIWVVTRAVSTGLGASVALHCFVKGVSELLKKWGVMQFYQSLCVSIVEAVVRA